MGKGRETRRTSSAPAGRGSSVQAPCCPAAQAKRRLPGVWRAGTRGPGPLAKGGLAEEGLHVAATLFPGMRNSEVRGDRSWLGGQPTGSVTLQHVSNELSLQLEPRGALDTGEGGSGQALRRSGRGSTLAGRPRTCPNAGGEHPQGPQLTACTGAAMSRWTQTPGQSKPMCEAMNRPAQELGQLSRSWGDRRTDVGVGEELPKSDFRAASVWAHCGHPHAPRPTHQPQPRLPWCL